MKDKSLFRVVVDYKEFDPKFNRKIERSEKFFIVAQTIYEAMSIFSNEFPIFLANSKNKIEDINHIVIAPYLDGNKLFIASV